jgi:uncharacterized RDD family membrane protein YckC
LKGRTIINPQQWYFVRDGLQLGPLTADELRDMIANGEVAPDTLVWKSDMPQWQPAFQQAGLFAQAVPVGEFAAPSDPYAPPGATLSYQTPEAYYAPRVVYAGFWLRFGGSLIDGLILRAIGVLIEAIVAVATDAPFGRPSPGAAGFLSLVSIVTYWLYAGLQESSPAQATLGKRACGIIVTDPEGRRISFVRASTRHVAKFLSALIFMFGFIMAGFTRRKQALHDMVAGTLVVKKPLK